jgi:hypothetical protein
MQKGIPRADMCLVFCLCLATKGVMSFFMLPTVVKVILLHGSIDNRRTMAANGTDKLLKPMTLTSVAPISIRFCICQEAH